MTYLPSFLSATQGRASFVLLLTFLGLTFFAVITAVETRIMTTQTEHSVRQSDLFQTARYWVGAEESLERKYRLEPGPGIRARHSQAAADVVTSLRAIRANDPASTHDRIDPLLALHDQYLDAIYSGLFPAVDAGDLQRSLEIDHQLVDPVFDALQEQVTAAATDHHEDAVARLDQLTRLQNQLVVLTPLVFVIGLLVLAFFWRLMQHSQARLDQANRETMRRLKAEATTDSLTSLGNHRAFQEVLGLALQQSRSEGHVFSLVRLDLDEFKVINDRHGHLYGDQVLASFGQTLSRLFQGTAYRVGGDEFAVLLPADLPQALAAVEALRDVLKAQKLLTISAGLTVSAADTASPDDLQQQADQALYEAKRRGRDRTVTFQSIADRATLLPHEQVEAFRQLLHAGAMDVAFQPIWQRGAAHPHAYEALARPPRKAGFDGPQELFDVAARLNRSMPLDELCWTTALGRCGALPGGALLFLNLSPQTLDQDAPLAPRLLDAVHAAGLCQGQVVIEITERSVGHLNSVLAQAGQLRAAGFRLALDDVGAGNSGLEMLRQLQVDFVKIDRSVVAAAPTDSTANAVLAAIMAYARQTGVQVIVEGIETPEMLEHGWAMGAQYAQGYLLGRPQPGFVAQAPADVPARPDGERELAAPIPASPAST
ncbi:bifunctional diguanylate cyclase/phosphodiesterase [Deinococcus koreensis]|uniref:bifunctional diguanylate cyclase/phosphodiesterase n=1 Tax=Deinococcus koreensis TaxID=2054903 RepID=UPI0013FDD572|nr:bifunctional diguanylate cyclase/phosphodiesterase [Deinococcus koreensis]